MPFISISLTFLEGFTVAHVVALLFYPNRENMTWLWRQSRLTYQWYRWSVCAKLMTIRALRILIRFVFNFGRFRWKIRGDAKIAPSISHMLKTLPDLRCYLLYILYWGCVSPPVHWPGVLDAFDHERQGCVIVTEKQTTSAANTCECREHIGFNQVALSERLKTSKK